MTYLSVRTSLRVNNCVDRTATFALEMRNSVSKSLILLVVQSVVREPGRDGIRRRGEVDISPDPSAHTKPFSAACRSPRLAFVRGGGKTA